jgi:hypothetical protein
MDRWVGEQVNKGRAGFKYGIWVSKDFLANPGSATWTFLIDFPFGNTDQIKWIEGSRPRHQQMLSGLQRERV